MVVIDRFFEMPRKYTFEMSIAKDILREYMAGDGWVDPFAGYNSPASETNDIDESTPTKYHLDAAVFIGNFKQNSVNGVLFDPPYSMHQCVVSYGGRGTSKMNALTPCLDGIAKILRAGCVCISWGWNTNGLGINRGFKLERIIIIAHGGHHNDTLVTIERKQEHLYELFDAPTINHGDKGPTP